ERHAKEIESSEKRFRSLAEATAEVLWIADPKGAMRGEQPSWQAFTGQAPEQYRGYGWMNAVHPDDRAEAEARWANARATGEPFHAEVRTRRRDGAWVYMETSAGPVRDSEGRIREWVGMNVDIQDRKAAEAERDRSLRSAEDAIQVRDDFLSIASHELKTPLTPLSTWLQLVQRRVATGKPIDPSWLVKARNSLDRLAALVNDLLDASRVQARRLTLRFEPVLLNDLVMEQMAAAETLTTKHELVTDVPQEPVRVMGEKARLEQVLANLLENAIKYSPRGGTIRVELHADPAHEAVIAVSDSGVGIPKDQIPLLFDRFFRARNISSRSYGGLGLGLYIVHDIVEHHGGRIWVESEVGVGSTFSIALPLLERGDHGHLEVHPPARV
ncbi:MAG TPA: ATP-binding protein, partial [Vulgatibacter sp.]